LEEGNQKSIQENTLERALESSKHSFSEGKKITTDLKRREEASRNLSAVQKKRTREDRTIGRKKRCGEIGVGQSCRSGDGIQFQKLPGEMGFKKTTMGGWSIGTKREKSGRGPVAELGKEEAEATTSYDRVRRVLGRGPRK